MSRRENSSTLYLYVKDYIMKLIISGNCPADTKLPTEFQLMEELNVGRATVRAALAQLEEEGSIYKKQGVGTFVKKREKSFGLEPFVSFSFIVQKLGLKDNNKVVDNLSIDSSDEDFLTVWPKGTKVQKITRIRHIEKTPIAIEHSFFTKEIYDLLDKSKINGSLAHNLLESIDEGISRIDTQTIVRAPNAFEKKTLKLPDEEKVVESRHCVFLDKKDLPVNYVSFVIPTHVLEFPFLG